MDDGPSPAAPSGLLLALARTPALAVGGAMDIDDGTTSVSSTSTRGKNRAKPIDQVAPEDLPAGRHAAVAEVGDVELVIIVTEHATGQPGVDALLEAIAPSSRGGATNPRAVIHGP